MPDPDVPISAVFKRKAVTKTKKPVASKYDSLMAQILELGADEVLIVPPGSKEWPPMLSLDRARLRLRTGLGHLCKKHNVTIRVERLEGRGVGISRTDV